MRRDMSHNFCLFLPTIPHPGLLALTACWVDCIPASGTAPASSCYLSPQRHYSLMFCPNLHLCHFQQSVYITGMVYVHSILMANHKSIHVHLHCLATLALPGYTWQHSQCIWTGLMSLFKVNLFKLQKTTTKEITFFSHICAASSSHKYLLLIGYARLYLSAH